MGYQYNKESRYFCKAVLSVWLVTILVALLFCRNCSAQVPKDKQDHFAVGVFIGFSGSSMTIGTNRSLIVSLSSAAIIGGGKELIYDKWMGRGTPEFKDFAYTVAGSVTGWAIVKLFKSGTQKKRHGRTSVQ
jgi:uncharacterized protein YfiM (DUF2279 family)